MKDIQVILLSYSNSSALQQALTSLNLIINRVKGVIVIDIPDFLLKVADSFTPQAKTEYVKLNNNHLGKVLNNYIKELSCEYVLFLYDQDYLNSNITEIQLELNNEKQVMTYQCTIKNITIQRPFFIKTYFLKQNIFFQENEVPFKEAILPSWLSLVNHYHLILEDRGVISQLSKDASTSNVEKIKFIEKYQSKVPNQIAQPSVAVMVSNYNMANYVGTAINSCFLQNSPPEQVLVVDDGSTDESYKVLEKWIYHPQFKLLTKKNGGKARALNELLPYIETDFIVELDADDWLDPDAIFVIRDYLRSLADDVAVLYGNLRAWKQVSPGKIKYKGIRKGSQVLNKTELLSYTFPLGPRIYRTLSLKENKGFPIIDFEDGRMYEDVSILNYLLRENRLLYKDFTIYNVREHAFSITKKNPSSWSDFLKLLN
ncbi:MULTISPECIES: glycosyltransferase family 2 protein [Priestia]|jgi:Glycosyl transferase family 2|uniref:Glycosyl transferase, group 2 family protein n=1 Tax=Priestia megaterium (strain ATCC 12872 / QMB1551) TaxID=545693 RepID=D5E3T4_PRIM1|nr:MULTISPECIES: glycosyltransferase family 2 protein [Priestia]ADE72459.1 glycosyl transferase, group 2 family protein [Priestia megaterium QM B1551]MBG9934523.1 glycosyl transferase family 2 [Priestia aryabhattai]WEZ56282.1 glycosyltransferase family 2 protein [Priestia megaterium]